MGLLLSHGNACVVILWGYNSEAVEGLHFSKVQKENPTEQLCQGRQGRQGMETIGANAIKATQVVA